MVTVLVLFAVKCGAVLAALKAKLALSSLALPLFIGQLDGGAAADAGAGDGGAGGGDADAGDTDTVDDGAQGDPGDGGDTHHAAAAADGDDADADPEDLELERDLDALPLEDRVKRYKTRLRRAQRASRTLRPLAEVLRDPSGRALPPAEVRRRLDLAQDMEELEGFFGQHPDVLQTILERRRGGGTAKAEEFVDPYADESKLWFDIESESGRAFLQHLRTEAREKWELKQELKTLKGGVQSVAQRDASRAHQEIEGSWKTATLKAAADAGLTPGTPVHAAFVNAVYGDFALGRAEKRLGKISPQQAIQRHLGFYKSLVKQQTRTTAATQHGRVAANAARPGPQSRGAATTAKDTKTVGTIKDGRKSFFERVGQNAPPR